MKIIIYKTETGIAKIIPAPKIDIKTQIKLVPENTEYKIVDTEDIPQDKDFYRALNYDLTIDIDKAKGIQKDRIRADRTKAFKDLDYQFMKALEDGKDYSDITKQKQALRDLPQKVDACKTLDEIKSIEV